MGIAVLDNVIDQFSLSGQNAPLFRLILNLIISGPRGKASFSDKKTQKDRLLLQPVLGSPNVI